MLTLVVRTGERERETEGERGGRWRGREMGNYIIKVVMVITT